MKYQANPVIADGFRIESIEGGEGGEKGPAYLLKLSEHEDLFVATPEMCSRMTPAVGDYWVVQSDGYAYLNPKDVFERKYSPIGTYQDRVRAELKELTERKEKLSTFINDSMEKLVASRAEQELLRRQLSAMYDYESILKQRIGLF